MGLKAHLHRHKGKQRNSQVGTPPEPDQRKEHPGLAPARAVTGECRMHAINKDFSEEIDQVRKKNNWGMFAFNMIRISFEDASFSRGQFGGMKLYFFSDCLILIF